MFNFDKFGRYETPVVTLCNPNKSEIGQLSHLIDFKLELNFNSISEITFKYTKDTYDGKNSNLYNSLNARMLLFVEDLGYYIVTENPVEYNDGMSLYKEITAVSFEYSLSNKKINLFNGTYKFYDILNPSNSLLGKILEQLTNWSIGYVSSDLLSKYRTFDVSDNTVYNFLMTDVEQSYECIFTFDTINNKINAYSLEDVLHKTDIYIDFDNLSNSLDLEIIDEELVTALSCFGSNGLNISIANPLGGTVIYNFDYFKNNMSNELKNAIYVWEDKIKSQEIIYRNLVLELRDYTSKLTKAELELQSIKSELVAKEEVQSVQIQQGIDKSDRQAYNETLASISEINNRIDSKQNEVDSLTKSKDGIKYNLDNINTMLNIKNNFSDILYKELDYYIIENTYQDDTFTQTSEMTDEEIQDISIALYDQSVNLLSNLSKPRYNITVDAVNFLFQEKFIPYANEFGLGYSVNLEVLEDEYIEVVALSVSISFDNPEDFSITFANRYRLNDSEWRYSDLYQTTTKSTSDVSFNGSGWNDWSNQQNDVLDFINSSLDLTRNELVNNSNDITMTLNQNGLRGKQLLDNGEYSGNQVWLTNNVLAFSDDGFQTVKTAIGNINVGDTKMYGLNAEVLIGKTILGNNLTIGNESNTVTIDDMGINVLSSNDKVRVKINTTDGIKIQQNNNGVIKDTFYSDINGNLTLEGSISALGGSIGGFNISSDSIYSNNGIIELNSDGTGRVGLLTFTQNSATFNGNIYARNLVDQVETDKLATNAVTNSKIANNAVDTNEIASGAVTPNKLDRIYATEAQFDILAADVATIERLYVTSAEIDNLIADYLISKTIEVNGLRAYSVIQTQDLVASGFIGLEGDVEILGSLVSKKSMTVVTEVFPDGSVLYGTIRYYGW